MHVETLAVRSTCMSRPLREFLQVHKKLAGFTRIFQADKNCEQHLAIKIVCIETFLAAVLSIVHVILVLKVNVVDPQYNN